MKMILVGAALALAASTPALAQSAGVGVLDQGGRNVYQFRSAEDRISRLAVAQEQELRRRGLVGGSGGGAGGGGSLAGATAINNYFQIQQTVDCSGTNVVCTGGNIDASGTTQTTTGSSNSANNTLTGNTVRTNNRNTTNNGPVTMPPAGG